MEDKVDFFHIRLEWMEGNEGTTRDYETYRRSHQIKCPGKPAITLSAAPQYMGSADHHTAEELLTAAISSGQMLTYLALASQSGIRILAYTDDAEGLLEADGRRRWLRRILLRPKILLEKESDHDKALELVEKAHLQSFIGNSVRADITYQPEVIIA